MVVLPGFPETTGFFTDVRTMTTLLPAAIALFVPSSVIVMTLLVPPFALVSASEVPGFVVAPLLSSRDEIVAHAALNPALPLTSPGRVMAIFPLFGIALIGVKLTVIFSSTPATPVAGATLRVVIAAADTVAARS